MMWLSVYTEIRLDVSGHCHGLSTRNCSLEALWSFQL